MPKDPTEAIRKQAASFPHVATGTSCNQSSFKAGKKSFLFLGPGAKGVGYKAMFRLNGSMSQAKELAKMEPKRFEVGSTGWVTARFTDDKPLPKAIWSKWLQESYEVCCGNEKKPPSKKPARKNASSKRRKSNQ